MKLIEPKVELWSEEGVTPEQHIARCARVCYGHEGEGKDPKRLVQSLINSGHVSVLRHASRYFWVANWYDTMAFRCNPYWDFVKTKDDEQYLSGNIQTCNENKGYMNEEDFMEYTPSHFVEVCQFRPDAFNVFRLTFCITTQISTSRELNRTSPNNIAERSTRYCSSKDGLEICKPWWWNVKEKPANCYNSYKAWKNAEEAYKAALELGMKPEDARGVLPLDTATKVVYTYSVATWKHIIDLRYYGKTGKPHPNAKLVIGMVRDKINEFAKAHNIDYQV